MPVRRKKAPLPDVEEGATHAPRPEPLPIEQPPKTFAEAVEREFGPGVSWMGEGVVKRFIHNPKPSDPELPPDLQWLEGKRQANLRKQGFQK